MRGGPFKQSLSIKVNGNLGCSYRNVMLHGLCVFKTNLSLFELFPKTSGIWEPWKNQQMSCRSADWSYGFMMLEIVLERYSDSWLPRNTKGRKQGNAMTTLSQVILSALECFDLTWGRFGSSSGIVLPLPLCKSQLWTGSRKLPFLQAKYHKNAANT